MHYAAQRRHRLEGTYTPDSFAGKEKSYNRLEQQEATDVTTRKGDTPIANPDTDKRWLRMGAKEIGNDLDQFDSHLLGQIVLPTSDYVRNHGEAFMRAKDRTLLQAAVGTAYSGEYGTVANALGSGQTIAVDFGSTGNENLTFEKLLQIRQILGDADVDIDGADGETEEITLACTTSQINSLLKSVKLTSKDYVPDVMALQTGKINRFLGINFKRLSGTLLTKASNIRDVVVYTKTAMCQAVGEAKTTIDRIPEKQNKIQIYSTCLMGAVRIWDERVIIVKCDETA